MGLIEFALPWEAQKAIHDHFAHVAAGFVNEGDQVEPVIFVGHAQVSGHIEHIAALPPQTVLAFYGSEEGKEKLSYWLHNIFDTRSEDFKAFKWQFGKNPNFVLQITEAWQYLSNTEGENPLDIMEQYGEVKNIPGRTECVFVAIHTPGVSIVVNHPILENPRRCELAPFPPPEAACGYVGRFSLNEEQSPGETPTP